jgi:peptidoglycan hydrolase CwlO-like protein
MPAQQVDLEDIGDVDWPRIAIDGAGNAIAVWEQYNGTPGDLGVLSKIWANRCIGGTGWVQGNARIICGQSQYLGHSFHPNLAADSNGNVIVVWQQSFGLYDDIWASRYDGASGSWESPLRIETSNQGSAWLPQIGMDSEGNAVVVMEHQNWCGAGYDTDIWANRYVAPDTSPPALSLTAPTNGATTAISVITVSGTTEAGAQVSVNGFLAAVNSATGGFSINLPLLEGSNVVTVTATDSSGNSATATRNVTFQDPIPGVQQDILDLQSTVSAIQSEVATIQSTLATLQNTMTTVQQQISGLNSGLADVRSQIAQSWQVLNNTRTALNSAWNELNSTKSSLTTLQGQVTTMRSDLTATQSALGSNSTLLKAAMADIDALQADLDAAEVGLSSTTSALTTAQTSVKDLETSMEAAQSDIDDRPTQSSTLMYVVLAIVVSIIVSVVVTMMLGRKKPSE